MHKTIKKLLKVSAFSLSASLISPLSFANDDVIVDQSRNRTIPINITYPNESNQCSVHAKCPVAFVNAGYGISHNDYTFASKLFNAQGYLSIAVAHELKTDPSLNRIQPYLTTRMENWHRGVVTLKFLVNELSSKYPAYDFTKLTLFGHSNGGDISALYASIYPGEVSQIVTLDHRRMLIPRNKNIRVLTLRGSDYPADANVLLNDTELKEFPVSQIKIEKSRHNDMHDGGPTWLVDQMSKEVGTFLDN
ncbi:alpha/beta hydrolase [Pseudoalteromonas atlantica]|uniref:Alpha/beta hydrolase n=1 Tax=Pseudoalteromonas atlantica TaxID=288 RepID=A0ABQ0UHK8_PSEAF|nr:MULTISPECIES: alpha/beta hydrolase [Pseudoalteromonas]MCW1719827.1 alpha/beta hydrolase [Pseudoalteromonas sp. A3]GEK77950.1 alpha/beta hydrolase [Pseudoalteromonas atlantica]